MLKKQKIAVLVLFLFVYGIIVLWQISGERNTIDLLDKPPELEVTAENLLIFFNDGTPELEYGLKAEQVLEIVGLVKETNTKNNRITTLLKGTNDRPPYIICDMQADQRALVEKLRPNDSIKIKGIFKGFLKDIVFLNCIVTYSRPND